MRLDLTVQFPSDDSKLVGEFKSASQCKSHVVRSGMRTGGSGNDPHTRPFMTTADAVANKARIQRGDKANEVDEALNGGTPAFHTAMAKQGAMHGIAVGGCCELSTSAHHLVAKIGEEQGYRLAESSGMDIEDAITIATRLLKGRIAKQVWRDYHKHAFARRCYADPSDMGLKALQLSGMRSHFTSSLTLKAASAVGGYWHKQAQRPARRNAFPKNGGGLAHATTGGRGGAGTE